MIVLLVLLRSMTMNNTASNCEEESITIFHCVDLVADRYRGDWDTVL